MAVVLALLCVVLGTAEAQAQEPVFVHSEQDISAICQFTNPLPSDRADVVAYLGKRHAALLQVYAIDVPARRAELVRDEETGVVSITVADRLDVGKTGKLELGEEGEARSQTIGFALGDGDAERLDELETQERLRVRLFFVLTGLRKIQAELCTGSTSEVPLLRGELVRVELVGIGSPRDEVVVARVLPRLKEIHALYGLEVGSRGAPHLQVRVEVAGSEDKNELPLGSSGMLRKEMAGLLMPCFLDSLARGGPSKAALVLEARFLDDGRSDGVSVAVDATGHPPLGRCASTMLEHARVPPGKRWKARFTAYFEVAPP